MADKKKPTYIDLINRFWQIFDKGGLGAFDISLYFLLLKEANHQGWPDTLSYSNRNLVLYSGISADAVARARNRLKQAGVLDFAAGNSRTAPKYKLFSPLKADKGADKGADINIDIKTEDIEPNGSLSKDKPLTPPPTTREEIAKRQAEKKEKFYNSLIPYVEIYGKEMVRDFFDYWTEPNKSGTQWKFEQQRTWDTARRLRTWAKNEGRFNQPRNYGDNRTNANGGAQQRASDAAAIMQRLLAEGEQGEGVP